MIIEYIRYRIPAEQHEAFESAYTKAQQPLKDSIHCFTYELSQCVEEPECYMLRIEWDSIDGHMQGFRRSAEFREFFSHIQPFVGQIVEMRHYQKTAIVGKHPSTMPA